MPAEPTASTALLWSCWPWSISPGSMPVTRRPARSMETPDLAQRPPVLAVEHLGPEHHDRTVPARRPQQPLQRLGGGSQSSCSSQIHSTRVRFGSVARTAAGSRAGARPRPPRRTRWTGPCRRPRPARSARRAPPRCGRGFRYPRRPSARPDRSAAWRAWTRPGSRRAPSCATMSAVTVCLVCGAVVDKWSSAGRGSGPSRVDGRPVPVSPPRGNPVNNTARACTRQDYGQRHVPSHDRRSTSDRRAAV